MGILDRIADLTDRVQVKALETQLDRIATALERLVDTQRESVGLPLYYVEAMPEEPADVGGAARAGSILHGGDYQLVWLIEELAREHRIPVRPETDLEALALERGWLSPEGKLLVVPQSAEGMEVAGAWVRE